MKRSNVFFFPLNIKISKVRKKLNLNLLSVLFEVLLTRVFFRFCAIGEDVPPMQLKEGVFRCIMQLYDCLLTEVHERCKRGLSLAKRLNSSLAFFCYDLLSIIDPRQVFELVCFLLTWIFCNPLLFMWTQFCMFCTFFFLCILCCYRCDLEIAFLQVRMSF